MTRPQGENCLSDEKKKVWKRVDKILEKIIFLIKSDRWRSIGSLYYTDDYPTKVSLDPGN